MIGSIRRQVALLIVGSSCLAGAGLLRTERPGLVVEYHANAVDFQSGPIYTNVTLPYLRGGESLADVLVSRQIFSLRWRGWILIEQSGEHRFLVRSNQTAVLRIDGVQVVGTTSGESRRQARSVWLDEGAHRIVVEFSQRSGRSRLALEWAPPGEVLRRLGPEILIAHRPVQLRRLLFRGSLARSGWLQGAGVFLAIVGVFLLFKTVRSRDESLPGTRRGWARSADGEVKRWVSGVFLLSLFLFSSLLVFPYTAATADGDDVRYMDAAMFNKKMGWNMNRYVHIYLLKGFDEWSRGDIFHASRLQWSFLLGTTVMALGVAIAALGKGLQLKALGIALFLLFAQKDLFGGIGAAYADYTAMMFVIVGVAVYLHGFRWRAPNSTTDLHALVLGAVAVAAVKSKETGLILLWLVFLMLWRDGRIDLRQFGRRLGFWIGGASVAYLCLMTLDAVVLGDFWFSLRPETFADAGRLKDAAEAKWDLTRWAWIGVVWSSRPLRYLGLLAAVSAIAAFLRQERMERRLFSLTPAVFMVMMISIHPPIDSPRYLFPLIPVACLLGAEGVYHLALSSETWRGPFAPRTVLLAVGLLVLFGPGFEQNRRALARHTAYQRGELILYPWRQFQRTIEAERPKKILVPNSLYRRYQMVGKHITRDRIARMYLRRRYLKLIDSTVLDSRVEFAIGDRRDISRWSENRPGLAASLEWDASGQIGMVRAEKQP